MPFRRAAHSVYDCWYHLVWTPKRRRPVLVGRIATHLEASLVEIGESYDIVFGELHIAEDHIHLYCSFPPRLSISGAVRILKSLSARDLFGAFPELRLRMKDGKLWEEGYFARTVGSGVDAEMVRRYIRRHQEQEDALDF